MLNSDQFSPMDDAIVMTSYTNTLAKDQRCDLVGITVHKFDRFSANVPLFKLSTLFEFAKNVA